MEDACLGFEASIHSIPLSCYLSRDAGWGNTFSSTWLAVTLWHTSIAWILMKLRASFHQGTSLLLGTWCGFQHCSHIILLEAFVFGTAHSKSVVSSRKGAGNAALLLSEGKTSISGLLAQNPSHGIGAAHLVAVWTNDIVGFTAVFSLNLRFHEIKVLILIGVSRMGPGQLIGGKMQGADSFSSIMGCGLSYVAKADNVDD